MICESCGREMVKNGLDDGKQKWACFYCGRYTKDDARPPGRPPKKGRAMSSAERKRAQREREKSKGDGSSDK